MNSSNARSNKRCTGYQLYDSGQNFRTENRNRWWIDTYNHLHIDGTPANATGSVQDGIVITVPYKM